MNIDHLSLRTSKEARSNWHNATATDDEPAEARELDDGPRRTEKSDASASHAPDEVIEAPPTQSPDKQIVINLLNEALASKVISVLRYRRHYFMAQGLAADAIKKEFLLHAEQEQKHADQIARRIVELGGEPNFDPKSLTSRSHAEYAAGKDLENMIKEDLLAEHVAAESYREMAAYLADQDPTTRQMLAGILAMEVEQAEELSSMLGDLQCLLSLWRAPLASNEKSRARAANG